MTSWKHKLGKHLLKEGALTYMISDEEAETVSWDEEGKTKQQVDMIVLYNDHMEVVELKETDAPFRKGISFKQLERYDNLCHDIKFKTDFWAYIYWKEYDIITGVRMQKLGNMQFHVARNKDDVPEFFVTLGMDPKNRIRKRVDFQLKIKNDDKPKVSELAE